MDDADLARVATLLEGEHGACVREHHVVLALEALVQLGFFATGERTFGVMIGGVGPDLVERGPIRHLAGVFLKAKARVFNKRVDGVAIEEFPSFKKRERSVKVMKRHKGLYAMGMASGEQVVVELHALGVHLSGALGEDARPGNRDANAVDAEALVGDVGRHLLRQADCDVVQQTYVLP